MATPEALDLEKTYLAVPEGPEILPMQVGPDFWQTVASRPELGGGARLLAVFPIESDWPNWEMHPAGDEVVLLLSGTIDVILECPDGPQRVPLRDGAGLVVPRGVWHTVDVVEPGRALHLTLGEGTQHRPR